MSTLVDVNNILEMLRKPVSIDNIDSDFYAKCYGNGSTGFTTMDQNLKKLLDANSDKVPIINDLDISALASASKQDDIITELQQKLEAADIAGYATSAKQDTIIGHIDDLESKLTTIDSVLDTISTNVSDIETKVKEDDSSTWTTTTGYFTASGTIFTNSTGSRIKCKMILFNFPYDVTKNAILKYNDNNNNGTNSFFNSYQAAATFHMDSKLLIGSDFYMESGDYFYCWMFVACTLRFLIQYRTVS
jgi:hypothetical protein